MLDGDPHDDRRQPRARNAAEPAEEKNAYDQQHGGIDQDRQWRTCAECPVGNAGTDIDAAGDAAKASGRDVGYTEFAQYAIAITPGLAGRHDEFGAEERIDRRDDRERE